MLGVMTNLRVAPGRESTDQCLGFHYHLCRHVYNILFIAFGPAIVFLFCSFNLFLCLIYIYVVS